MTRVPGDLGPLARRAAGTTLVSEADTSARVVAGDEVHALDLPAGEHSVFVTAEGSFSSVRIEGYDEAAGVCVTTLRLGLPEESGG